MTAALRRDPAGETREYTLTSSPVDAMFRPVTLLVGLEDEADGALRVYLGARYKGIYLRLAADDPAQDDFRRAWDRGGHCWMYPIPDANLLHRAAPGLSAESVETPARQQERGQGEAVEGE